MLSTLLFASLWLYPRTDINSCGWSEEPEPYQLFMPALLPDAALAPLTFSWHAFQDTLDRAEANVQDWQLLFKGGVQPQEVHRVVYTCSPEALKQLRKESGPGGLAPNQGAPVPGTMLSWLLQNPGLREPLLDYLDYAKACEPLAVFDEATIWAEDAPEWRNAGTMRKLLKRGEQLFVQTESPFLKARIGYQMLRLMLYNEEYAEGARFFKAQLLPLAGQTPTRLVYWSMANAAGCLRNLGRDAEAAAAYAQVFVQCPELRVIAAWGYRIQDQQTWAEALDLAKTTEVQCALYLLRALQPTGLPLEEMRNIYRLSPQSALLELLLVREVQKQEQSLPQPGQYDPAYWEQVADKQSEVALLTRFVQEVGQAGKARTPGLWQLAAAHLLFLQKDYKAAEAALGKVSGTSLPPQGQQLVQLLRIALPLAQYKTVGPKEEAQLHADFIAAHGLHPGAMDLMRQLLAMHYTRQKDVVKQHLVQNIAMGDAPHSRDVLLALIAFMERPSHSPFEQWLLNNYAYSVAGLYEAVGISLLAEARFDEAIPYLEKGVEAQLPTDPFVMRIRDCHDCDHATAPEPPITRLEFAKRMAALQKQVHNPQLAPSAWLMLGHGLYNMGYYGNCWMITRYDRNHGTESYSAGFVAQNEGLNRFMDCEPARYAYKKAAELSKVREQQAEALFFAAKCELNQLYNLYVADNRPAMWAKHQTHFAALMALEDTRFFQRVSNECSYPMEFSLNR
jgi:tetratricopeptide (TPR) repeat protein